VRGIHGVSAWTRSPIKLTANVGTFVAGLFICVAGKLTLGWVLGVAGCVGGQGLMGMLGTYVSIKLIIDAYDAGTVGAPFAC
jgi:hypothetical protein